MTGFMDFLLTVCDAYTCKLTKLRFHICIIRYNRYFFFDIDIDFFQYRNCLCLMPDDFTCQGLE
jgi:hypothetical protein